MIIGIIRIIEDYFSQKRRLSQTVGAWNGTRFARKDYAEAGGKVCIASCLSYLPRIPRIKGFDTDSASASPQDSTDYTDSTDVCGESVGASGRT